MPNIKIHWKGRPHHRLPRIRVASTPRNSVRSRSQLAAEQVLRVPLANSLEQARKKQRFNWRLRRRRGRSSRSAGTSAVVRSRRHASQRARQHIQVFGWGTSQAELANRGTFETASIRPQSSRSVGTTSGLRNQHPQLDSVIPSTDGAASSSIRRVKAYKREPETLYSLMHVAKVPVYWKSRNIEKRKKSSLNPDRLSSHSVRRPGAEYAHVGPLETVSRRNTFRGSQTIERRRTYDCRIDLKNRTEDRSKSGPARIRESTSGARNIQKKQQSRISTELWEAINSLGLQTKAEGADTPSNETIVRSSRGTIISDSPSRTPSQRKTLRKFTREIELYLQACRSLPKGTLVATPSLTTISARTIDELKPYQEQFQSAGLAVTSDQQRRLSKLQIEQSPPPTPPKDEKWSKPLSDDKMVLRKDRPRREPSYASGSTGTTVLGWTPPHEKELPKSPPKTARQPSSESDHTIIGFTPPHERVVPPPARPPPAAPKPPSKKSLPWLRKPETSPESVSPTGDKTMEKIWKSGPVVPPRPISKRPTKVVDKPDISAQRAEMSTQTNIVDDDAIETRVITTTYADMATQTHLVPEPPQPTPGETTMKNDDVEISRAPIVSGRNKTFPLVKNKCRDDCRACSEPVITSSGSKFRKQSRVKWEGVDRLIQTDDMEPVGPQPEDENQHSAESSARKLCTKSANELKPATPDPEPELQAKPEPKPDPKPSSSPPLCHTCTSRSSLICQQCFPSRQVSATISPLHTCPWDVADQESRKSTRDITPAEPGTNPEEPESPPIIDQPVEEVANRDELPDQRFMPIEIVKEIAVEYADQPPIPDPVKRPSLPRLKLKQSQSPPQRAQYSTSSRSKPLPQAPQPPVVANLPIQLPDLIPNSSLDTLALKPGKITDKQVFKGLHVATAAACDEDVDKWIEEITGCGVRRFLADLSRFEGLGVNTLADVARRAARQRREKAKAWEIIREARVARKEADAFSGGSGGKVEGSCVEEEQVNLVVGDMGVVASDGVEEELVCRVVHSRDCKESEGGKRDSPGGC